MSESGVAPKPTWRSFAAALLVASSGVTYSAMSVWSRNFAQLTPLRLVQLVALEVVLCGGGLAVVAWRGGHLTAWAVTFSLAGLLFGAGDALAQRVGTSGAWVLFLVGVAFCAVLLQRVADTHIRSLRVVALWLSLFLLLQPIISIVLGREVSPARIVASPALVTTNTGVAEDFLLVVLDGYASIATLRDQFSFDSPLSNVLTKEGFEVVDSAWSPSTRTLVSISSLVNLAVPLVTGDGLTGGDVAVLLNMIRGDGRLFSMFRKAGYEVTYIESGWMGSVCGETVTTCIRRPFVDEAVQAVVDRSLLSEFAKNRWGHAFALAGLRALAELEQTLPGLGANGTNDMVFAHVILPHDPYVLGSDCQTTGTLVFEAGDAGSHPETPRAAYLKHVNCVDQWLTRIAAIVPEGVAVVLTGDHGTLFRGQMSRPPATWSAEDIAERAQTFLATKLSPWCANNTSVAGSLEAVMDASACLLATRMDRAATETLWLFSEDALPRCITLPGADLAIVDVPCGP